MKKILLLLIFAEILFSFNPLNLIFAEQSYFARIKEDNVYLYSTPEDLPDTSNQLFELPKTYFVEVLEKANDYFYKVKYIDIIGYAKTIELTFVKGSPVTPYNTKMTFRIFAPNGIALRKSPNTLNGISDLVTTIPFLTSNIIYYGDITGEEWIVYKGNIWHYCKYITETGSYYGYVYSAYCDLVVYNDVNTEVMEETTEPIFTTTPNFTDDTSLDSLPQTSQVLLICIACLPCILIVYLLFKPTKTLSSKKIEPKKKIKRLKKSDYFEFDDEYLNS